MQNGTCSHCGAETVYMKKNGMQIGESNGIYIYASAAAYMCNIHSYVCTSCGYFENFLAEPEFLQKIAQSERWTRVTS
jgi:hypothetical protein